MTKKRIVFPFLAVLFFMLASFSLHKFYVSIYQINYAPEKKMLQITSRIFSDDFNAVLYKKYGKKTFLGESGETPEDVVLMKKYLSENVSIKVNGQVKAINYLSKEVENNVIICYYNSKEITKIKTLEIQNTALFDLNLEQQNIIQTNFNGKKQSLLLTPDNIRGMLK
ncbi:MAG: DUF6702 family protein [Bacteroidota bacterium]